MSTATRTAVMTKILSIVQGMTFTTPINGATTWRTVTNRLKLWGDVPVATQPYCALVTHAEQDEYRGLGNLYRRRLNLGLWCYSSSMEGPGQPDLDTMMESFEQVFNVVDDPSQGTNTLGGLVYWCRIQGKTFKDPGDLDNQTLLIVPLVVEMP